MQFFSNKIYVNGSQKSFNDIINDVTNKGMVKEASKQENKSAMMEKTTKGKKMPKELVEKFKAKSGDSEKGKPAKKPGKGSAKGGLSPAQKKLPPALQKAILDKKSSDNNSSLKIASIDKINDDEVMLTLTAQTEVEAEMHTEASGMVMSEEDSEVDIEDAEDAEEDESEDKEEIKKEDCGSMATAGWSEKESCWSSKSASESPKFVKIANLTDKQKNNFRKYWGDVWPKEFIDAILSTEN